MNNEVKNRTLPDGTQIWFKDNEKSPVPVDAGEIFSGFNHYPFEAGKKYFDYFDVDENNHYIHLHRDDGPAVIHTDGTEENWKDGVFKKEKEQIASRSGGR